MNEKKNALVTLLTSDDFLVGVQVLVYSFRKNCKVECEIVVLATKNISKATLVVLKRHSVKIKIVNEIPGPVVSSDHEAKHWSGAGLTKLHIWNETEYDRVLYIDADCVVLQPIDELFDRELGEGDFAAAPDIFPPDHFNAGVILLRPSAALFTSLREKAGEILSYDGGDTGYLNAFFPAWYTYPSENRLAFAFNAQRTVYWLTRRNLEYWKSIGPIKILHFSSTPKPWELNSKRGDLEFLWWEKYRYSIHVSDFEYSKVALEKCVWRVGEYSKPLTIKTGCCVMVYVTPRSW